MRTSGKNKRKREPAAAAAAEHAAPEGAAAGAQAPAAEGAVVSLASHCSVKDAQALKAALSSYLAEPACVTLDVRSLERIDTASMQLLCAFVRERAAGERRVAWLGDSQALEDAARLLGVSGMLAFPSADIKEN